MMQMLDADAGCIQGAYRVRGVILDRRKLDKSCENPQIYPKMIEQLSKKRCVLLKLAPFFGGKDFITPLK